MDRTSGEDAFAAWYAARPWLARYPPGVPERLESRPGATAGSLLDDACDRWDDRIAFDLFGAEITFREWRRRADALARWIVAQPDCPAGGRMILFLPNVPEFAIATYAAWRAGLVAVPLHTASVAHELVEPLADAAPCLAIVHAALLPELRGVGGHPALRILVVGTAGAVSPPALTQRELAFEDALASGASAPAAQRGATPDALAVLQYTGGTTGVSKAVATTHANLVAQVALLRAIFADRIVDGRDRVLAAHPFFHSLGLAMNLLAYPVAGGCNVLMPRARDYAAIVASLARRQVQAIVGGPALYIGLLAEREFAQLDFGPLRACFVGGMPLRPDVLERWEAVTGVPLTEGYGLTEVAGASIVQFAHERRRGSVGLPCPGMELTVRDAAGRAVRPGDPGEIWMRGPCLMPAYYGRPDETARAITADGWFRTGDLGRVDDDGFVFLLDRIKDIIIISNSNVYPTEIEAVVGAHPGVADVAAVGIPDADVGESVKVVVVRRDPALTAQDIASWCAARLADFKRPRAIEFRDALPRSAVGKVLRRALRAPPGG
jgi:long-chain acyl-CoA synthetase